MNRPHASHRFRNLAAIGLATSLMLGACSPASAPVTGRSADAATTTDTPPGAAADWRDTAATASGAPTDSSLEDAADLIQTLIERYEHYVDGAVDGNPDPADVEAIANLYDTELATLDDAVFATCIAEMVPTGAQLLEHSVWIDSGGRANHEGQLEGEWFIVSVVDNHVVPSRRDDGFIRTFVIGPGGLIGDYSSTDGQAPSCFETSLSRTAAAEATYRLFAERTIGAEPELAHRGPESQAATGDAGEGEWRTRPGFPADPNDPEPIRSTGSNKWDLIRVSDPTAFTRLEYLGRGPEEILSVDKEAYESVADAFLFRAHFSDGTSIEMRIHPEFGTEQAATEEAQRYVVALGQLPTLLRVDIGRFAVRRGEATATGSPGEGISMQSGNADIRIADNRLEETLFHEAVHTSLDRLYAYQRSASWLEAQAADGRFLTEYGRENPDSEDFAETALYAFAILHYPGRTPAAEEAAIRGRIPNRLAFIESLFPQGQPLLPAVAPEPS